MSIDYNAIKLAAQKTMSNPSARQRVLFGKKATPAIVSALLDEREQLLAANAELRSQIGNTVLSDRFDAGFVVGAVSMRLRASVAARELIGGILGRAVAAVIIALATSE